MKFGTDRVTCSPYFTKMYGRVHYLNSVTYMINESHTASSALDKVFCGMNI